MISLVLTGVLAFQTADAVASMQSAVERQRASVRKQVPGNTSGFFTTAWVGSPATASASNDSTPRAQGDCEALPATEIRKLISEAAVREGVNPLLLRAMIDRESGGKPCAVSPVGAEGLMQLMPGTASDLGVRNSFNAEENVGGGARYLKQMLERYKGDLRLALAAYNAGPQRVDDAKGVPGIPETQAYVQAILSQLGGESSKMQ